MAYPKDPLKLYNDIQNYIQKEREESHTRNQKEFDLIETQGHDCVIKFQKKPSDNQWHEGYNRCHGITPMILKIWFSDQDGCETFIDNWTETEVKFCPFCGKEANL